ncbi:reverse transcriptase domain-containing protein [Tanacetum coccineum]
MNYLPLRLSGSGSLPRNTFANSRGDLKAITTRSGISYNGPPIPLPFSPIPKVVEREPEVTTIPYYLVPKTSNSPPGSPNSTPFDGAHYVSCEEYAQEVLGFSDTSTSGNPTPSDPIIASSFPSCTPFEGGDFILEEIEACLSRDSIPLGIDDADFDPEGYIRLLEKLLNYDPSSPLPPKELNFEELKTIKSSFDDPPELELKDLPSHLEYAFLEETDKLPVIISKELKDEENATLLQVLKSHKRAIAWKIYDIKGIDPHFCTHKILMENDFKQAVQHQIRVSPVHCVPKKGGMTTVKNEDNELIPTRLVTGWRVCIDYRKLNDATRKDHFSLPFMDQMLERLARNEYYCFLDGFSGYFQISIDPQDQEKTTFTCPYGMFAYRHMPFGLCNAPGTFQRCMMTIFHDMIKETMEVFMDDFLVFEDSFSSCLSHLEKNAKTVRRYQLSSKLGEVSFHG